MKIHSVEHFATCANSGDFPRPGPPEVAFLGRSNCGKSSLLNKLVKRKRLARTSSTPGKTRLIQFFRLELADVELFLVDLPGYGYAQVSRRERQSWQKLVESYLGARATLRAAILLQDIRRDISEDETLLLEWLAERDVKTLVTLTKADKFGTSKRAGRVRAIKTELDLPSERIVTTSAKSGLGMDALWRAIWATTHES